jgi:4a-hydroxytetrahydrobiopterin dehydratase
MDEELASESCTACDPDARRATATDMAELLPATPGWEILEQEGIPKLYRRFPMPDFATAMAFANRIAELAAEADHHPELRVRYERVTVRWWTHKLKGLHRNDFIMAAKTNEIFEGLADR